MLLSVFLIIAFKDLHINLDAPGRSTDVVPGVFPGTSLLLFAYVSWEMGGLTDRVVSLVKVKVYVKATSKKFLETLSYVICVSNS